MKESERESERERKRERERERDQHTFLGSDVLVLNVLDVIQVEILQVFRHRIRVPPYIHREEKK